MKKKIKLDEFHYHEALDRSYCVADIIENLLLSHPAIKQNKDVKKKIRKSQKYIMEAYHMLGNLEPEKEPEKETTNNTVTTEPQTTTE